MFMVVGVIVIYNTQNNGTFSEQLELKKEFSTTRNTSRQRLKIYVNCNMCHGMKGEGGIVSLIGSTRL